MSANPTRPGRELWLATLRHEAAALAATPGEALHHPVPGHTVREAHSGHATHSGHTVQAVIGALSAEYRWVADLLSAPGDERPAAPLPTPPSGVEVLDWWQESYRTLLAVLTSVDGDRPAWNWAPQPKRAAFWLRRMAHLTALDRWDVQRADGTPEPLEPWAAADGIAELFDTILAAKLGVRAHDPAGTVGLTANDVGQEWLVRLRRTGFALLDTSSHLRPALDATATGPAGELLLALTGRAGFELLGSTGDTRLLAQLVPET